MLKEPRLAVFYSPPKHDLKLKYDAEMAALKDEEDEEEEVEWPDTHQLLGEDPDYQKLITSIMEIVEEVMDEVTDYSRVSKIWMSNETVNRVTCTSIRETHSICLPRIICCYLKKRQMAFGITVQYK